MKVAIVYDRVNKWGGAERVLLALHEIFPNAPLYTSVYNSKTAPWARVFPKVVTSFMQKIPFVKSRHELFAFLMPFVFESLDFSKYDLVISVTSESAKGIITGPKTKHLCYLLTPTRYLWNHYFEYFDSNLKRILSYPFIFLLKKWDFVASSRPDEIISISQEVQKRTKLFYQRDSVVIYPPVEIDKFKAKMPKFKMAMKGLKADHYYLVVSRLVPYKKIDLVVKTFNLLGLSLVIVGTGSTLNSLQKIAKKNIKFVGLVSDEELAKYYTFCKALIFPQEEDFGITSLEVQSVGKPVIAYKKGGALETVIEGKTGVFFEDQSIESLMKAIKNFEKLQFNPKDLQINAQKFSKEKFKEKFVTLIEQLK